MNLNKIFLQHCEDNKYEINQNQIETINNLKDFYDDNFNQSLLIKFFKKKDIKLGFYLVGDVGVGKTMILNFFFEKFNEKKLRLHFNEFMIEFHNFIFENKDKEKGIELFVEDLAKKARLIYFDEFQVTNIVDAMILGRLFKKIFENKDESNGLDLFVKELSKSTKLIYFDEFQVTNIVDAMILGKLFEVIFEENIKIIITTNTKLDDLYKDGLQRDQFLPFISIIENFSIQKNLQIKDDYRTKNNQKLQEIFYPLNEKTSFKMNQRFREFTKNKKKKTNSNNKRKKFCDRKFLFRSCKI